MNEDQSISALNGARSQFLDLLAGTLELELRLLHSTEADPGIIAREHKNFAAFLDRLAAHPQNPHVQQFSDMNQDEFVRAETDYLDQFSAEAGERGTALGKLLLIDTSSYAARNSISVLAERMADTRRSGWSNQFTESQRSTVVRILDPEQYYGKAIAQKVFGGTQTSDRRATHGPTVGGAPEDRSSDEGPDLALLRMKAQVIADKLDGYNGAREKVLTTALLKVKVWLAGSPQEPTDATKLGSHAVMARRRPGPAIDVFSSMPRDLLFVYYGRNGSRAIFHLGVSNAMIHQFAAESGLPLILVPGVSLLLVSPSGEIAGSAYVSCTTSDNDAVGRLALLIKTLDFTGEFMRLAGPSSTDVESTAEKDRADQELLNLAEEL